MKHEPTTIDRMVAYNFVGSEGDHNTRTAVDLLLEDGIVKVPLTFTAGMKDRLQLLASFVKKNHQLEVELFELQRSVQKHNEEMHSLPVVTPPTDAIQGINVLADWFDALYKDQGKNDAVQVDLRKWAKEIEELRDDLAISKGSEQHLGQQLDEVVSDRDKIRAGRDGLAELLAEVDWAHACGIELAPREAEAIVRAKLLRKLVKFARHTICCDLEWYAEDEHPKCSCGFEQLQDKMNELHK